MYGAAMSTGEAVEARSLRRNFKGEIEAVRDIDLTVARGEVFGFLGPNGAGKTTTLEMIEGLREPDAGDVTVLGHSVWPDPRSIQTLIGVQLQTTSLFDMLTARELLVLFARFYLRADADERAESSLAQVGLESKGADYAKNLSGGQQQRLAIALALVHDPEIVFLDEPTTGLDPQARRNLWDVIRSINQEHGKTVVLTTHYLEEAEELCDRVAIMDEARIVALDTPAGLIEALDADARVSYTDSGGDHAVYVRDVQATVLEVLERARASGETVQNLSVKGADLEDVFLSITGREYRE
jgi:ABC-2 type transport system ATP-binding protein